MNQQLLPVAKCYESETNPRGKKFDSHLFDELVASVRQKGVLVPVLARPKKKNAKEFEIVAGNRRYRAACLAGFAEIPVLVKDMTDEEAREAQIIENLQRADIHPLEEGEAYRALIEESKFDVKAVAAHVGKSESYIRDRLLLSGLIPTAKKALREGTITAGHASLIGRLDSKVQKEALEYCESYGEPDIADLREWIRNREYADMSNAPWKNDEAMNAALGGCEECEGKGGDLFGAKAADACTNPKCYARRMAAYIAIKLKDTPELSRLSSHYGRSDTEGVLSRSEYTELHSKKDKCELERKGIVVEGDGIGRIIRFCAGSSCETHGDDHTAGYNATPEEKAKLRAQRKKEREAAAKKAQKDFEKLDALLSRLEAPLSSKHLAVLFDLAIDAAGHHFTQQACKRRKLQYVLTEHAGWNGKKIKTRDYGATLKKAGTDDTEKLRIIVEVLSNRGYQQKLLKRL
jgi:ParB family chromosome partitioning protein